MAFGKRIKQMIMHLGVTQNEFGRRVGVSSTVISHWVTERNEPTVSKLVEMLNVFPEFSTNWLVRGIEPMLEKETEKNHSQEKYNAMMENRMKILEESMDELKRILEEGNKK